MLVAEPAIRYDLAAAGKRHAMDLRCHDFDLQVIVMRTIVVTSIDHELVAILEMKSRDPRAAVEDGDTLLRSGTQCEMTAAAQLDRAERRDAHSFCRKCGAR